MVVTGLLILLILANGAPVIAALWLGHRWAAPIDGNRLWRDGCPILGRSKTWRGLVSGTLACTLFSWVEGLGWLFGICFALLALGGDLISSFIKRRRGLASSARALGLDQVPESLLPMGYAWWWLELPVWQAMAVVVLFVVGNIVLSPLLYHLGIRRHPH